MEDTKTRNSAVVSSQSLLVVVPERQSKSKTNTFLYLSCSPQPPSGTSCTLPGQTAVSSAGRAKKTMLLLRPSLLAALFVCAAALEADTIKKVYVLWSNHYDMGYTLNNNGSCAGAVVNEVRLLCALPLWLGIL